ncbi:MAG: hypothetical protein AYK19_14585 [Theionarchaea archaeon DG-70-1]|nr:MAG: hypothetical protein AYK19_14585 [Theionarchaea archaeon DG-70-1]
MFVLDWDIIMKNEEKIMVMPESNNLSKKFYSIYSYYFVYFCVTFHPALFMDFKTSCYVEKAAHPMRTSLWHRSVIASGYLICYTCNKNVLIIRLKELRKLINTKRS